MRRLTAFFLALILLCGLFPLRTAAYEEISTDAKACIVMEAETGRILGGYHIEEQLPMASTTKIMTSLLALEAGNLDEWFEVDSGAIQVEGSSMGLQEGDQVTLRALLYGMLLPSGNDAANAAAVRISGDQAAFVTKMNQKAEEMGLSNTHFQNPSGLDAKGHYSTALDMANLTREAMKNETFREICSLSKAQVSFGNPPYNRWLENYNKLLTMYPHCIGVKTGFTEAAYRCLVSAASKDGITLICVTLNCADDWETHERLYEHYFGLLENRPMEEFAPTSLSLADGAVGKDGEIIYEVPVTVSGNHSIPVLKGEEVTCEILCQPLLFAPVSEGKVVGEVILFADGEELIRRELIAAADLQPITQEKEPSLIDRIADFILQLF